MEYKGTKYNMFGGKDAEIYNALHAAFAECSGGKEEIYDWLEQTPKTSMIVELVDKLKEMGLSITSK